MPDRTQPTVTLSPQQRALVDWVGNGEGSAFGEAVAGSGKTTTALYAVAEMRGSVAVMAYNKAAAVEFGVKARKLGLNFDNKVRFGTCHSFGLAGLKRTYPGLQFGPEAAKKKRDMTVAKYRANNVDERLDAFALKLCSLAKNAALGLYGEIDDKRRWYDIVEHHDLAYEIEAEDDGPVTVDKGVELAIRTLKYHRELCPKIVDFDDMLYYPVVSGIKLWQNDWVVGDEWQDANVARRALARKMLRPGGRALFIGDRYQAIYGFTGADSDSIDATMREFKCSELPLTVTFRCPKAVVAVAREVVPHIEAHSTAPEGKVEWAQLDQIVPPSTPVKVDVMNDKDPKVVYDLQADDAILCRLTRPLVSLAFQLIKRGVACHVEGRDIGAGLIKLIDRFKSAKTLTQLRDRLETYTQQQVAKLTAKGKETQAEALMDRVETVYVLIDSQPPLSDVAALRERVRSLFVDGNEEAKPTLTLATVHRSKGREWGRVFVLGRDAYMPSPWARQEWQQQQERNLIYVAVTRAMKELVLVSVPKE